MVNYFLLEPEVAGELGAETKLDSSTHPPRVSELHYELSGWLGDDILESFPCYLVSERCAAALGAAGLSGYELDSVIVTASETFRELYDYHSLPKFHWFRPNGKAGVDDFWLAPDNRLAVSETALAVLRAFKLDHCDVEEVTT